MIMNAQKGRISSSCQCFGNRVQTMPPTNNVKERYTNQIIHSDIVLVRSDLSPGPSRLYRPFFTRCFFYFNFSFYIFLFNSDLFLSVIDRAVNFCKVLSQNNYLKCFQCYNCLMCFLKDKMSHYKIIVIANMIPAT